MKIAVVGAGQAGASLVAKLRALGHDGPITLIGQEPVPPYQRPPLSKKYLLGEMDVERLFLRPVSFYEENAIDLRTGVSVTAIDRAARTLALSDGTALGYDRLALTTGSAPRLLPESVGGRLGGVFAVRTLADIDAMAPRFTEGARVLIVGGGYIGLEAAAVASLKGLKVTLIEMAERILQRVAAPETSDYFRALHEGHGVSIREGIGLSRLTGEGQVAGAVLSDGSEIPVDFVITGIGIAPDTALAEAAGLEIDNGIRVDEHCRTSDESILAAGDCASFPWRGGRIRLESVQNAIDQGEAAAAAMMGSDAPYLAKPWFWSDQYDVKLQIAGLNAGYDSLVARPGPHEGAASLWYYKGDELLAVDAMNDARSYMVGKRLIETGRSPDKAVIADAGADLKPLLRG
ncbi:MAG: NAD(P)/FAD-dependent oxidoreductase [Paracoccaceae bacterium]